MAKLAKDIAAGAVLIATVNAIAIGYLVFSGQVANRSERLLDKLRDAPAKLTLISLVVVIIVVIATKAISGRGTPLRGGLPSGHAAIAFAGWMAATYVLSDAEHRFLISSLTFIMALLVAQTRVEAGVHSTLEVAYGGLLGALDHARAVPGVRVSGEELVERARAVAARAYAPYSQLPRRRGRAGARRARVRGRERRERGVPARDLRGEVGDRARRRRRVPARATSRRSGSRRRRAAAAGSGCGSSGSIA